MFAPGAELEEALMVAPQPRIVKQKRGGNSAVSGCNATPIRGVGYAASERRWTSSLKVSKSSLRALVAYLRFFGSETGGRV